MGDTARERLRALIYRLRCRAALACWRVLAPDDPPDFPPPFSHLDGDEMDDRGGQGLLLDLDEIRSEAEELEAGETELGGRMETAIHQRIEVELEKMEAE
jgi:hypothetical protein